MNFRKHSEVQRVLSFLVICGLMSSVVIPLYGYGTSGSDSGYGEEIPYVYAYVTAYSLRYTGDWVKAEQSAYLQNTSTHRLEDVTYDWRFRLQITGINENIKDEREQLTPVIRESITEEWFTEPYDIFTAM